MANDNLKPVSTRLDPETVTKIDMWLQRHKYWKRNTVINGILTAVVDNFDDRQIYDMVRYMRRAGYQTKAEFEIIRDTK
jgi:hypothetical protein